MTALTSWIEIAPTNKIIEIRMQNRLDLRNFIIRLFEVYYFSDLSFKAFSTKTHSPFISERILSSLQTCAVVLTLLQAPSYQVLYRPQQDALLLVCNYHSSAFE